MKLEKESFLAEQKVLSRPSQVKIISIIYEVYVSLMDFEHGPYDRYDVVCGLIMLITSCAFFLLLAPPKETPKDKTTPHQAPLLPNDHLRKSIVFRFSYSKITIPK